MCFEVPAFVPPGAPANGTKNGSDGNDANGDDLSFMDSDANGIKPSNYVSFFINRYHHCRHFEFLVVGKFLMLNFFQSR